MITKKPFYWAICFALVQMLSSVSIWAQPVSPYIFGQNAWMPDYIGSKNFYGKLHSNWDKVKDSQAKVVRFGGIAADQEGPTIQQYLKMIDAIQSRRMEPIMQVPFYDNKWDAQHAADIVYEINIVHQRNIKYWIIGNEPDHAYGYTKSSQVAPYIKAYASAMKDVDPSIKTIGPETAWYNKNIIYGLTEPGGADDITGTDANGKFYIDIISFHSYPLGSGSSDRNDVISRLTSAGGFHDLLDDLNARIANCNSYHGRTGNTALKTAVTEANVNYSNHSSDDLYGTGVHSFIGGQFWAEMMSISMKKQVEIFNFWSVIEGNSKELNIGYLDRNTEKPQPAYYHFQMMAGNFKGNYLQGSDNQANVKSFGAMDGSGTVAMIMNQDDSQDFDFTIRLDNGSISGNDPLKINLAAGLKKEFSDVIENQSSILLKFDEKGNITEKIVYRLNGHANAGLPPEIIPMSVSAIIHVSGSTTICEGESVVLKAEKDWEYTYQWKKNGQDISGATDSTYEAKESGSYQLEVFYNGSSDISDPVEVNLVQPDAEITADGPLTVPYDSSVTLRTTVEPGKTCQWLKNDTLIVGADSTVYEARSSGDYQVEVFMSGCGALSEYVIVSVETEEPFTSIQHGDEFTEQKERLKVYPNPGNGSVTVELNNIQAKEVKLQVINVLGTVVHHQKIPVNDRLHKEQLQLDHLPSGTYVLKITEGQISKSTYLVISR